MNPIRPARHPLVLTVLAVVVVLVPPAVGAQNARDGQASLQASPQLTPLEGDFVATTRVNVREQPSARATRIEQIDGGSHLRVTGKVADAPWYSVVTQSGRSGFVSADLLRSAAPAPVRAPTPEQAGATGAGSVPVPAPVTVATPVSSDPALLERLDKLQARLDEIERRLPPLADLQALAERRTADQSRMEALNSTLEMAKGMMDTLSALQEQVSTRFDEQRDAFEKVSDRLKSVEDDMQPAIEWAKRWTDKAPPLAEEATGWMSTVTGTVYGWIGAWMPWGAGTGTGRPQADPADAKPAGRL